MGARRFVGLPKPFRNTALRIRLSKRVSARIFYGGALFSSKKLTTLFSRRSQNTG